LRREHALLRRPRLHAPEERGTTRARTGREQTIDPIELLDVVRDVIEHEGIHRLAEQEREPRAGIRSSRWSRTAHTTRRRARSP
jgi:hypothetical protein